MSHMLVFGLSADPIHRGHSDLVADAALALIARGYPVGRALIVPVYRRNLPKRGRPAPYEHRVAMCRIAAEAASERLAASAVQVEVSQIEQELAAGRDRPNYTVETLSALGRANPSASLIFLMSSDLVSGRQPEFARWYRPEDIVRLAVIAIAVRPGYPPDNSLLERFEGGGGKFVLLTDLHLVNIFAREIRARIASGEDPLQLADEGSLLPGVAQYIAKHHLYRGR